MPKTPPLTYGLLSKGNITKTLTEDSKSKATGGMKKPPLEGFLVV